MLLAYYLYTAWIPKHTCIVWILPEYSINNAWNLSNHHLKTAWILPWYNDSFVNSIKHRVEPDIAVCRPTDLKFVDGVDQKFLILVFCANKPRPPLAADPIPHHVILSSIIFNIILCYSMLFCIILQCHMLLHVIVCYCTLLHACGFSYNSAWYYIVSYGIMCYCMHYTPSCNIAWYYMILHIIMQYYAHCIILRINTC